MVGSNVAGLQLDGRLEVRSKIVSRLTEQTRIYLADLADLKIHLGARV
jgi:hypothetical protein